MYSVAFFFDAEDLALGLSWTLTLLQRCKTQPPEAVILPTTKLRRELWKGNLEEEKLPPWPPGYPWSETQTFKGRSFLEVASNEIFLVLAHLILESSGQLCRTSKKPSGDIGVCVRSFSGRNSHKCLKRKTKPSSGSCEEWIVNIVEPCWQDRMNPMKLPAAACEETWV